MPAQQPRVSMGLPVYNGEQYLATALDSLLAQTFTDFEIVISDNASTDATEEICRRYAARDARIRYVRQPENRGSVFNFNHVFELARGEYYRWHAHDDVCAPTFLDRCVELLDQDPTIVGCHSLKVKIDQGGRVLGVMTHPAYGCPERSGTAAQDRAPRQAGRDVAGAARPVSRRALGPEFLPGLLRPDAVRRAPPNTAPAAVLRFRENPLGRNEPVGPARHRAGTVVLRARAYAHAERRSSAKQQRNFVAPTTTRWCSPIRLQLLWGHTTAVWQVPLTPIERLGCLLAVVQYVLQLHKWKHVLREMLFGAPLQSAERLTLAAPPEPVTVREFLESPCN